MLCPRRHTTTPSDWFRSASITVRCFCWVAGRADRARDRLDGRLAATPIFIVAGSGARHSTVVGSSSAVY